MNVNAYKCISQLKNIFYSASFIRLGEWYMKSDCNAQLWENRCIWPDKIPYFALCSQDQPLVYVVSDLITALLLLRSFVSCCCCETLSLIWMCMILYEYVHVWYIAVSRSPFPIGWVPHGRYHVELELRIPTKENSLVFAELLVTVSPCHGLLQPSSQEIYFKSEEACSNIIRHGDASLSEILRW